MDLYAPIKGKCRWWRELPNDDDRWDRSVAPDARRVNCVCFVEGDIWEFTTGSVPEDCPVKRRCRYHIVA